ncbi:hypothetical protein ABPG72_011777 [Tetrahymena utriculariae]
MSNQTQFQLLQDNYLQIAKNNLEAIMLSFNRVLYLLGYHEFLQKNKLEVVGQNLKQPPFDINIEFEILLFSMLNLKQIPGLSENDQLKSVEENLFQFYKPLNKKFVVDIFNLSLYSIKGDNKNAKAYFQKLKQQYPKKFEYSSQPSKDNRNQTITTNDTSLFEQPIPDNQVLESVQIICKAQFQGDELINNQLSGKIKDDEYNKNLYQVGLLKNLKN